MDLFGPAPNLNCSNEAVCYNALPAHFNTPDSRMVFDCIVSRALLVLNFDSNSVLLLLKLYIVQPNLLDEPFIATLTLISQ